MLRKNLFAGLTLSLIGIICFTAWVLAASDDTRVANAAMKGDREAVRSLLKQAADVNAAQGDGMTALHWAALKGDVAMAQMLLSAGANLRATTRLGGYSPLFMASKSGASAVVDVLLKAGADPKAKADVGMTPLMMAAMSGDRESVRLQLDRGAEINARETENGQTSLMFAAAFDRPGVIEELAKRGADLNLATEIKQPPPAPGREFAPPPPPPPVPANPAAATGQAAAQPQTPPPQQQPMRLGNDLRGGGNPRGGLTALMYAAREGQIAAVRALLESGAKPNVVSADKSTAVLLAAINGRFDTAKYLVEHGADLNIASVDGAAPLYAVVHTQWSRESFHPQPTTKLERTAYLDLLRIMLDFGAEPDAKLSKALWYSSYGYVYAAASPVGTTAFWKLAEVADIDGMKLLLSRGADPKVTNKDGVTALLIASGAGTHGNDDVMAPPGRLAAVKFLIEELHMDVNAADNGGSFRGEGFQQQQQQQQQQQPAQAGAQPQTPNPAQPNPFGGMGAGGFTALHNAASRGDNEMILYLVSKGARVDAVTKTGVSVVDMANGPRQRVQPYADTIALLEILGAKNSHKCISC